MFVNPIILENENCGKDMCWKILDISLNKSWTSCMWDQYLLKNMTWKSCHFQLNGRIFKTTRERVTPWGWRGVGAVWGDDFIRWSAQMGDGEGNEKTTRAPQGRHTWCSLLWFRNLLGNLDDIGFFMKASLVLPIWFYKYLTIPEGPGTNSWSILRW